MTETTHNMCMPMVSAKPSWWPLEGVARATNEWESFCHAAVSWMLVMRLVAVCAVLTDDEYRKQATRCVYHSSEHESCNMANEC